MNGGSDPVARRKGKRGGLLTWFRRFSLRTRLIAAFVLLIVSSALATIVIADMVLGSKVVELAMSNMEVGLKMAEQNLSDRLQRMKLLARMEAERWQDGPPDRSGRPVALRSGELLDFIAASSPQGVTVIRGEGNIEICAAEFYSSELGMLISEADRRGEVLAGFLEVSGETLKHAGYRDPPQKGVLLAAAAPLPNGGTLLLGTLANGRNELVTAPVEAMKYRERHAASLFLGGARIATTLGDHAIGSLAEDLVVKKVLKEGEFFFGSTIDLGKTYCAAYRPIKDYRGKIIGMLGVGTEKQVYTDLSNQTLTLFSGLIALGMMFGFAMTYMFSAWLIRPVSELAKGMDRVARDDLNYKVRIGSADELGRLAKAFNLMVKNIKERDIRLREMTAERLSQVEKQVSIGRLAAGVAHEINNPLTSVLSLSMLMLKQLPGDDSNREDLQIIVEETTRCREIVRNLLDFARERPAETMVIDLGQVIRETLVLTSKYDKMDQIQTFLRLSDEPLFVNGDPKQLQQVFTNIITNAAEATGNQGKIIISVDEDSSGGFVVTRVQDNGKGIPPDHLNRVFQPFFTTKGPGKGTGLGLSVSLGIIRRHGGTVEIDSQEKNGTTVTVLLPRVADNGSPHA